MKKILLIFLVALACAACNKEEHVEKANIVFSTVDTCSSIQFWLWGSGTTVIDWGDGSDNDTIELKDPPVLPGILSNPSANQIVHDFAGKKSHTVRISGENITHFYFESFLGGAEMLNSLDVSRSNTLTYLDCGNNSLTSLDMSNNPALRYLICTGNQLMNLDVSKNTELKYLSCGGIELTSLDVSKNTELTYLSCGGIELTSLDVSNNTALINLLCSNSSVTSLDVSANTALTMLWCNNTPLTNLDVKNNVELRSLNCRGTLLMSLDLSTNTKLASINITSSQFSAEALNALFHSLHSLPVPNLLGKGLSIADNPGTETCDISIAEGKGWNVYNNQTIKSL